jgi:hypothetical protein
MSYLVKLVLLIAVGMGVSTLVQMGRNDALPYGRGDGSDGVDWPRG